MEEIIQILQKQEWLDGDIYIQIAKGRYELPEGRKETWEKMKRGFKIFIVSRINKRIKKQQSK
jgi:hypothetical protein